MPTTLEREHQLQGEIAPRVEHDVPGVDVLAVELLTPSTDEELQGATAAQSEAFGGPPLTAADAERMRATIASGGIVVAARELATGTIVGAGVCTPPADEVTELAGAGGWAVRRFIDDGAGYVAVLELESSV